MQTIQTKVLPATNTKPTRIKATHEGGIISITISRSNSDDIEDDYCKAAKMLKLKLGWTDEMQGGHYKEGMVFVFVNDKHKIY